MRKLIFPTLAAAVLVSACSKNDQLTTNNGLTPQTYAAAKYGVDIKPIAGGGFIILGNTSNSIAGGSSWDTERDFVLIKTDADGNVVWTRTITDNTMDDVAKRIIVLPNNAGFALAGTSRSITTSGGVATFGKQQAVIQTFDAAGVSVSAVVLPHSNTTDDFDVTAFNVLANGNYILGVSTTQVVAKVPTSQADTRDMHAVCLDAALAVKWSSTFGSSGEDAPIEIAEMGSKVVVLGRVQEAINGTTAVTTKPTIVLLDAASGSYSNLGTAAAATAANFYPTAATFNTTTNTAMVVGYTGTASSSHTTDITLISATISGNTVTWGTPTQLSSFGTNLGYTGEMPVSIQAAGTGYVIASKAQRGTVTEAHLIRLSSTLSLQWDMLFGTPVASDEGAAAVPVLDANGTVTHVAMVGTFDAAVNPSMFFVKASN